MTRIEKKKDTEKKELNFDTKDIWILVACTVMGTMVLLLLLFQVVTILERCLLVLFYALFLRVVFFTVKKIKEVNLAFMQKTQAEKKAVEAELEQKRQQLLALENQINPHFLYNTLDTFRGVALENNEYELSNMIEALSSMFKYSVNYDTEMVNINSEIDYLSKYIQIQQLRFPDRFKFHEIINCTPEQLLLEPCPRFVLQPLVENALHHGLGNVREGGAITITMETRDSDFYIIVEDNGCGMKQEETIELNEKLMGKRAGKEDSRQNDKKGIGLMNVNKRIKMFCGEEYGIKVISAVGVGTQIEVCLPLYEEARIAIDLQNN